MALRSTPSATNKSSTSLGSASRSPPVESFQESAKKSALRSQAIERARRENIRHLVFYVYDRIARNFTDAEILEELVREGVIVIHVASGGTVLHEDSDDSEEPRSGNGGATKRSAISSRRWSVTHASKAEPCVMTYKSTSPR